MTVLEAYWLLFTDILVANIFFTFRGEMVNKTMCMLGGYNKLNIALISAFASTIAGCINYIFGRIFYNIYKSSNDPIMKRNYAVLKGTFSGRKILLLTLNVIPIMGKFLMLTAGFIRLSVMNICVIIFISRLIYYILYL
jgi:membrane protein YqaA with SNARE-associated domain